jgi:hypothetical protein
MLLLKHARLCNYSDGGTRGRMIFERIIRAERSGAADE